MKRFTDAKVSNGCDAARARAAAPTITVPSSTNETTDGSSTSPVSGCDSTRGPCSSSTATRLFVVPRSMPTVRSTGRSQRVFDVTQQGAQVVDLGEPLLERLE